MAFSPTTKALVLLILAAVIGLGVYGDIRHNQQQAILAVLNRVNRASVQVRRLKNGNEVTVRPNSPLFSKQQFITTIERIPTGRCPQEFQMVWLDFTQTLDRSQEPLAGLDAGGEYVASFIPHAGGNSKDALNRLEKLNVPEAWRRVERVALKYGVQLMP
jgi:hypothetical protein